MTTILSFKQAARRATRVALALIAGAALLCACTQEDTPDAPDSGDRIPVTFSAGIESAAVTRTASSGETWISTDHIGIIMTRPGSKIGSSSEGILYENREYFPSDIGTNEQDQSCATFTCVDGHVMYYPRTGEVNFYAYYPYTKIDDSGQMDSHYNYTIDLSDQSNPAAINVLFAEKENVTRSRVPVEFSFMHVFAKVTLKVTAGDGLSASDIAALKAEDVKMKFDNSDLVVVQLWSQGKATRSKSATSPQVSAYKESTASDGVDATFSFIILPGNHVETPVKFTIGGKDYTAKLPEGQWQSQYNHVYPVTVRKTGANTKSRASVGDRICIEVGTCSIKSWEVENKDRGMVEKETSNSGI